MSTPHEASGSPQNGDAVDRVLQAKYLDWCSARVANRLFKLPPEEIYELARTLDVDNDEAGEASTDFRAVVGRLTEELTRELGLPDFAQWREMYAASPRQFDDEMVGFWREATE